MQVAYKERGGNPLKHFGFLLLGVISAILSLCWLIHIVLYIFIRQPAPASQPVRMVVAGCLAAEILRAVRAAGA